MLTLIGVAALLSAPFEGNGTSPPWTLEHYRLGVTAGVQCRYADGSKAILLRTSDPARAGFIFTAWALPEPEVIPLELQPSGEFGFEASGGVMTYYSIRLATSHLLSQPSKPLGPSQLDAFLRAEQAPACAEETFYNAPPIKK